ncbi:hypothetical protein D3C74_491050 [compost metagenome]
MLDNKSILDVLDAGYKNRIGMIRIRPAVCITGYRTAPEPQAGLLVDGERGLLLVFKG